MSTLILDRREFLKTGAITGGGLLIGFHLSVTAANDPAEEQEKKTPNPFDAWVHISPDNKVTLILEKSEMGQGIMTAVPMILAEELCVDWKKVTVEQAPTNPAIYNHGTGGSGSVSSCWLPMRQAGAAAREMLVAAAAERWKVNPDTCVAQDGGVLHGSRKNFLTYGELATDAAKQPIPDLKTVPLKNSNDFTIVGRGMPRWEARVKTNGIAKFGIDWRVEGMQFAVVARCPVFGGKVKSFDAAKAKAVAGVREVFAIDAVSQGAFTAGGVAIVADNSWAAMQGRKALQVEWERGPHASESSETLRQQFMENAAKPGKIVRNDGDADPIIAAAGKKVEATYEFPFAAHATMEPMNCTVHIRPDSAEAWVPTQAPQWARDVIAGVSKLPKEKITVHTTLMGGGFGRRYMGDFVMEAAQISKVIGKPVMVLWTREDDMQHDFYRPASYHQTPNYRVEYMLAKSGVPRAWWRSVEHSTSGFVVECFVDELAAAAGADPLEFRMRLIGDDREIPDFTNPKEGKPLNTARLKGVLKLSAEKAGWGAALPSGVARGIAGYFSFESYTAAVAEVSVKNGALKIHRLVYAVDCGRAVNPEGVRAQVEGAAIYGLSAALHDAITIDGGRVVQTNFNDYQMPRIAETPETEIYIVPSKEEPTGIGEPGLPVVAASVCNAIYSLRKKRIRRLPIRSEDLA
jgi:isoquinoline 1-oxidoreductase subunit beta